MKKTDDLYLAAVLVSEGFEPAKFELNGRHSFVHFGSEASDRLLELSRAFYRNEIAIHVPSFRAAIRELKDGLRCAPRGERTNEKDLLPTR